MRMCSPALESSNSGRTNITLPAAMRTPANPLSVPAVDSLRKMSRPVHVKTLLTSAQPVGDSRVDFTRVTPRPPPAYGCVRPLPKYLMMRAARGRDGRVEAHVAVEVALGLLGFGQHFDSPAVRRLEADAAADGTPTPRLPSSSQSWTTRSWRRPRWIGQTREQEKEMRATSRRRFALSYRAMRDQPLNGSGVGEG